MLLGVRTAAVSGVFCTRLLVEYPLCESLFLCSQSVYFYDFS